MNPTLCSLGDSITFMEDQLESLGIFPFTDPALHEAEIGTVGDLAKHLIRLRRTVGALATLHTVQYQSVVDWFCAALRMELAIGLAPKPVRSADQLVLFDETDASESSIVA